MSADRVADPDYAPPTVPIRDAATVVLLRDGADGLETWLLTRVSQMAFAAGMSVFPGGRVDEADADLPFTRPASELAGRFGCPEPLARALLGAAVRETFEETGVLLTGPSIDLAHRRAGIEAGEVPFGALLREHGLLIEPDALRPWARWVTPEGETRRYDTRFFVGALPPGSQAADVTTESSAASWIGVGEALDQVQSGERMLLPPTVVTLASIAPFPSVAAVLAASSARDLAAVRPLIRRLAGGGFVVDLPDGTTMSVPPMPR